MVQELIFWHTIQVYIVRYAIKNLRMRMILLYARYAGHHITAPATNRRAGAHSKNNISRGIPGSHPGGIPIRDKNGPIMRPAQPVPPAVRTIRQADYFARSAGLRSGKHPIRQVNGSGSSPLNSRGQILTQVPMPIMPLSEVCPRTTRSTAFRCGILRSISGRTPTISCLDSSRCPNTVEYHLTFRHSCSILSISFTAKCIWLGRSCFCLRQ